MIPYISVNMWSDCPYLKLHIHGHCLLFEAKLPSTFLMTLFPVCAWYESLCASSICVFPPQVVDELVSQMGVRQTSLRLWMAINCMTASNLIRPVLRKNMHVLPCLCFCFLPRPWFQKLEGTNVQWSTVIHYNHKLALYSKSSTKALFCLLLSSSHLNG